MKSSKGKATVRLALLLVLIAVAGFFGYSYMDDIKLGLDLAGGVSITYQAKEENPSAEDMSDTIYKLQQRVESYSTEAEVYQEGDNRINIDIPGESDANEILTELGKPGSLAFMDSQGNTILTGDQVASAQGGMVDGNTGKEYVVSLTFTEEGTKAFADATTNNVGKPIYIVYDNEVVSAPVVREAITGGQCTIDGMSDFEEAENLAGHHPDRFPFPGAGGAALQRGGRQAGPAGHYYQLKGRSCGLCHCGCIYDCRLPDSRSGGSAGFKPLCGTDSDSLSIL